MYEADSKIYLTLMCINPGWTKLKHTSVTYTVYAVIHIEIF